MVQTEAEGRSRAEGRPGARRAGASAVAAAIAALSGVSLILWGGAGHPAYAAPAAKRAATKTATTTANATARPLAPREARELAQALRRLEAAVGLAPPPAANGAARGGPVPIPVERPGRTVAPPTITSGELDRLVGRYLAKNDPKVEPAPLTTDAEFVRRVYFDLIGRPPEPKEFRAFVQDRTREKRARLIDKLIASPECARNWARYWRDVVRYHATTTATVQVRFDMLEDWLAKQFRANRPWDEIATGMITATGRNDENGAVGLALAHEARPVELAGEVSRIFLGVQIQCAQCHDHKTDSWKRQQFHEFAAFFSGARRRRVEKGGKGQLAVFAVLEQGRARYAMPDKNDPKKTVPVAPRFFLSSAGENHPGPVLPEAMTAAQRRELAASYVTGQDNPWFARAFVNRTWYVLMGEAFYEPIDDIGPEREATAPEILNPLAEQWQRGGYDVHWLLRTLLNTRTYQRAARSTAAPAGKTEFASGCPSRMRADQVFDALAEALTLPLDADGNLAFDRLAARGKAPRAANGKAGKAGKNSKGLKGPAAAKPGAGGGKANAANGAPALRRLRGPRVAFDNLFGVDPSTPNGDVLGTIPQALFMMNGPLVHNRTIAKPGTFLGELLDRAPSDRAALNALYLRVLSRPPTSEEDAICARYLKSAPNRREAFEDVYWGLVNSTEFVTRR